MIMLYGSGPEGPELEGKQANREYKATSATRKDLSGTRIIVLLVSNMRCFMHHCEC